MKLVLDTNVLIAALISHGTCHEVLEHCVRQHELIASTFILNEVQSTLLKKFHYTRHEVSEVITLLKTGIDLVTPLPHKTQICRDPDDDMILATAVSGSCKCIVTGDNDLLELVSHHEIDIVLPSAFWRYEQEHASAP